MSTGRGPARSGPLVILGGAAVQAEAVHAAHALGREVHVVAAECGDAAREAADEVVLLSLTDVDAATRYAARVDAAAVYSVGSDLAMPVVAEVSKRLGLPSPVSPRTAHLCHHKHLARMLLREEPGSVEHASVTRGDRLPLPLPVIVKPDDGQGQRGLSLVTSEADYPAALEHALAHSRSGRAVVEEYVPGPEISVNGFLRGGQLVFVGVSDRVTWPDQVGLVRAHTFPSQAAGCLDVHEAVVILDAASRRIGLREGPVYAQMIVGPSGVRLVEVSPRLDGCHLWRLWRAVTGVDLLLASVVAACGDPVSSFVGRGGRALAPVWPQDGEPVTTIEFDCLPPGTAVPEAEPVVGPDVLETSSYYAAGALVRPVNGRLEKVGWTLRHGVPDVLGARTSLEAGGQVVVG